MDQLTLICVVIARRRGVVRVRVPRSGCWTVGGFSSCRRLGFSRLVIQPPAAGNLFTLNIDKIIVGAQPVTVGAVVA